jgi:hypothetical protein
LASRSVSKDFPEPLDLILKEVDELLKLRASSTMACGGVRQKVMKKIDEIDNKMSALKSMKETLQRLVDSCKAREVSSPCPIIESMVVQ